MALIPLTFTEGSVLAQDDAIIYNNVSRRSGIFQNIGSELQFNFLGTTFTIQNGYFILKGRAGKIINVVDVNIDVPQQHSHGYIILKIDLNEIAGQQLTATFKQQEGSFPPLVQEDLNNGGNIYEFAIASYEIDTSGIVSEVEDIRKFTFEETDIPISNGSFDLGDKWYNYDKLEIVAFPNGEGNAIFPYNWTVFPKITYQAGQNTMSWAIAPYDTTIGGDQPFTFSLLYIQNGRFWSATGFDALKCVAYKYTDDV